MTALKQIWECPGPGDRPLFQGIRFASHLHGGKIGINSPVGESSPGSSRDPPGTANLRQSGCLDISDRRKPPFSAIWATARTIPYLPSFPQQSAANSTVALPHCPGCGGDQAVPSLAGADLRFSDTDHWGRWAGGLCLAGRPPYVPAWRRKAGERKGRAILRSLPEIAPL
jgi:hypothetical protein